MSERVIIPRNLGFLFIDSHPAGCARVVNDLWSAVVPRPRGDGDDDAPVALVIGSSAGYGLAATVAGLARAGIRGVGVAFEKAPTERRSATAGWYRTAATAELARAAGQDMRFLNGDAFSDGMKEQVGDLIEQRFGRLDHLIYSVAAPRRIDPETGVTYHSVLKPIGATARTRTLAFDDDGKAEIREAVTEPAGEEEIVHTVGVMGGADWERWVTYLAGRRLLADGFSTAALSYIGSPLNAAMYRQGTVGAAKAHLEQTARTLDARLREHCGGRAVTSVNGAAVTQSSMAIPGIALYTGLLRRVLGDGMVSPVDQLSELWDQLTGVRPLQTDDEGRVRLDTWELTSAVQDVIADRWDAATTDTVSELADLDWFRDSVRQLYGFSVPGVDYSIAVETDIPWPAD
ncbi:CBU_0270 family Dot/Icm type IV secretion system effector [Dactylosporangium fulvum]|uniref:trans-2-enoyl-CoA reductase (NAD(+)) n=1 Tax=Dactylosporangium fulvum TaxID=53359 RepID=A0ABY5W7F6_9ACTN|nr:enoyl-[acyl-carrier-protein] reductase FabV [Dactylosporangium fulvum]UWP85389.1 enoyl-[acyl-carrier-protein] reductase FabV [Dactylosporangium fulvum]